MEEQRQVSCGERTIEYTLTRKKVKNINLRVKPDGSICVSANRRVPYRVIDSFIRDNRLYIFRTLDRFKERQRHMYMPQQYVSGESISILGKTFCLKVMEGEEESVYMQGGCLYLQVKDVNNFKRKEKLAAAWIKKLQTETFDRICLEIYPGFQKYGTAYPQVRIRKMSARWGSCQPQKGIVTLNSRLISVPFECIEYVVLHEFAHFIHPNHSKQFYDFVAGMMPDWKERKEELDRWY